MEERASPHPRDDHRSAFPESKVQIHVSRLTRDCFLFLFCFLPCCCGQPVLFRDASSRTRSEQVISLLFSDAQTHYSEYRGNVMFEANACGGDGAMIKNVATNFENNILADSSMPNAAWVGSYSGPVFNMTFSRNVYWNSTGFCNGGGWPSGFENTPPGPGSPIGLGSEVLSNNYILDNGYACGFRGTCAGSSALQRFYNSTGAGIGGVFVNASGTCYHSSGGAYPDYGCNHYPVSRAPPIPWHLCGWVERIPGGNPGGHDGL